MTVPEADETVELPEDLVAICLDTNAMPRGRLDLEQIEGLLEVLESQELNVVVWIPEPVLWEWAEHLASDLADARTAYEKARAHAVRAGVGDSVGASWEEPVKIDRIIDVMFDSLEGTERTIVLPLKSNPHAAVAGLRDQVLVQGAGRRKSNVKVGAADSSSYRLAEAELQTAGGSMVLVSGDQDAKRHFAGKSKVLLVPSISRTKAGVVGMRSGSQIAVSRVRSAVEDRLPDLSREVLERSEVKGAESLGLDGRLRGRVVESTVNLASIVRVGQILSVEVTRTDGFGTALVEAVAIVERELQVLDDVSGLVEMDVEVFDVNVLIEVSAESTDGIAWEIAPDVVHIE